MRPARLLAALALAATPLAPSVARAQEDLIDLDAARRPFVEKQYRAAAYALRIASSSLRTEIGRCHDETIGAALIEAEPRIDRLAARVAAGGIPSVEVLDKEFTAIDRMMAQHHQALAAEGIGRPRLVPLPAVGKDLGKAANYLARSVRWNGATLDAEATAAVAAAREMAALLLTDPARRPAEAGAVIERLGKVLEPLAAAQQVSRR